MAITITPSVVNLAPNISYPFAASGGTGPYTYSLTSGSGTIGVSTGLFTAPNSFGITTITVTDSLSAKATATVNVLSPIQLLGNIIANQLGISSQRVYLWDQKVFEPTDQNLFVVISLISCKPFSNNIQYDGSGSGLLGVQSTNFYGQVQIDIISRGLDALNRKEEVIMALMSQYSETQQEANNFKIASLPVSFVNLSGLDGSAIPYRFAITVGLQWLVTKNISENYYNTFNSPSITTEP